MLSIPDMPLGWALAFVIVSGLVAGRREVTRIVLGLVLILRAQKRDLPVVARALFERNTRK